MYTNKSCGYPHMVRRDPEVYNLIDKTNKNVGRLSVCVVLLSAVSYFTYKKIKKLSEECEKLKETGK